MELGTAHFGGGLGALELRRDCVLHNQLASLQGMFYSGFPPTK